MNEDLMWERLKDIQREVENSRLHTTSQRRALRPRRWLAGLFRRISTVLPIETQDEPTIADVA